MKRHAPPIAVRPMRSADIPEVIALQTRVFPGMAPWKDAQLESHLHHFPEGQLVAEIPDGQLVGSASALVVLWADYDDMAPWKELTGAGYFTTHNPHGKTLYGADIGVDPAVRGQGVGQKLLEARKALVAAHALKRMIAGGRIPGYARLATQMSAEQYVEEVLSGQRHDPVLSFQLANGFVVRGVIPDYLGFDQESRGYATLIEWVAPDALAPQQVA